MITDVPGMAVAWLAPPAAIVLVGAVVAGFVQGISGFALALVATVFWSGILPPQVTAPLIALASIAGQALSLRTVLPSLSLRAAAPMVLGGLAGVPLGVALLPMIDGNSFRLSVGVLLCLYCPAMLCFRNLPRITWGGIQADAAAGAIGGVMGGIAGLAGPVPILWCGLRGWPADRQRATFQTMLIVVQAAGLAGYAATGLVTAEVIHLALWLVPCALLPSWLGTLVYARLGGEIFRRLVLIVLALTGVALLVQGIAAAARGSGSTTISIPASPR